MSKILVFLHNDKWRHHFLVQNAAQPLITVSLPQVSYFCRGPFAQGLCPAQLHMHDALSVDVVIAVAVADTIVEMCQLIT